MSPLVKTSLNTFLVATMVVMSLAGMIYAPTLFAQADEQAKWNEEYRSDFEVPVGTSYTGKSPFMKGMARPAPVTTPATKPAAAPKPAPAQAPVSAAPAKVGCSDSTSGLIWMNKTMPAEATLGTNFTSELNLSAKGCAANVVVRDSIPTNATYVSSDPAATQDGNTLVWKIGDMNAGDSRRIRVTLRADREGTVASCASVSADPRVCAATIVGKPVITIDKTGPETAVLGANVTYNFTVKNTGSAFARNVVVNDAVPEGLSGQPVTLNLGDIAPGQSKNGSATFKTTRPGKVCNVAIAESSNAGKVSNDACTIVLKPGLKIEESGTKEQIIGRSADYEIVVSNTGDTVLNNVVVIDTAPYETSIVAAPSGKPSGNKATWTITELKPGAKWTGTIKLDSKIAGTHCNSVTASVGGLSDSAKACTLWKGIPAVLLEKSDDPDPIQVGESTTYTVKVTNQGFADIHNVKVVAVYDALTQPISSSAGTVTRQNVNFPVVSSIAPKQAVTYTIKVKGIKAGDSRNKIILTCDELKTPVEAEESTAVY